jgi:hypothetical protein
MYLHFEYEELGRALSEVAPLISLLGTLLKYGMTSFVHDQAHSSEWVGWSNRSRSCKRHQGQPMTHVNTTCITRMWFTFERKATKPPLPD